MKALGHCPLFSICANSTISCFGRSCAWAIEEDGKFKCCAIVEIANKGKKPEEQTTVK